MVTATQYEQDNLTGQDSGTDCQGQELWQVRQATLKRRLFKPWQRLRQVR
jgi:hypothetical protein